MHVIESATLCHDAQILVIRMTVRAASKHIDGIAVPISLSKLLGCGVTEQLLFLAGEGVEDTWERISKSCIMKEKDVK